MAIRSINPANGEIIKEYQEYSPKEVKGIIFDVNKSFSHWKKTPLSIRSELLRKAARLFRENKIEYASLMALEMGKPIAQAEIESEKCASVCEFFADNAEKFLKDDAIETEASKSYIRYQPLGVIFSIMPWNFPFYQVIRCAASALIAGNTIILKHSSNVPGCSLAIEKIFFESEFPDDVFRSLLIGPTISEKIIANKAIKAVTFTGSSNAGKIIAAKAGKYLKKVVLELGGSDPFIILDDVNVKNVVEMAKISRLVNSGQSCVAAKRFIVMENVAGQFETQLAELMQDAKVGDPLERDTEIGPLAREDLLVRLDAQVQSSIKKGAILLTGGKRLDRKGFFYEPTVLSKVTKGMPVYDEETFGPVAPIIRVKNVSQAIKIANDTKYGLGASIWTGVKEKGEELIKHLDSGMVFINDIVRSDPRLPFGGIKDSGYGKELGKMGIKEFVNAKTVFIK